MATGNFISLFNAVKVNGYLLVRFSSTFFKDITPFTIVWVRSPVTIKDIDGNDVSAFQIAVVEPQSLTFSTFYLQTRTGLTTLANFASGLTAVSSVNLFTQYSTLVKSSDQASSLIPAGVDVLVNDNYHTRQYLASKNQTVVTITLKNRLSLTQMWFSGDDTYSGHYLYFVSTGNA